jgi:hypothetical protein
MMTAAEFFDRLANIDHAFRWSLDENRVHATIQSGTLRGTTLNPVTAVAFKAGLGVYDDTIDGTRSAAARIGLDRATADTLYRAAAGTRNRGNTQVFRGYIRSLLGV